jgi:hypothetical protein
VKRLELVRVRVCSRCGRGGAELRCDDGELLVVPLDPVHARQLAGSEAEDVRPLTALLLERLDASGLVPGEVVLDVAAGGLRALFSLARSDVAEPEITSCPAGEGVTLAVRGGLRLYATDEALAHASARRTGRAARERGPGGSETVH